MAQGQTTIEVYEWQAGDPRPGTVRKHRDDCIDLLEIPSEGLPNVDYVVLLSDGKGELTRYRIISREFLWGRLPDGDPTAPSKYFKVWIHVRRLTDEEYRAEEAFA